MMCICFFFRQKTAYEMRISDWSSDVSSDLLADGEGRAIDFSNTVVFLTSNLATEEITRLARDGRPDVEALTAAIHPVLAKHFKPALLARMTVEIGRASCRERVCKYV